MAHLLTAPSPTIKDSLFFTVYLILVVYLIDPTVLIGSVTGVAKAAAGLWVAWLSYCYVKLGVVRSIEAVYGKLEGEWEVVPRGEESKDESVGSNGVVVRVREGFGKGTSYF